MWRRLHHVCDGQAVAGAFEERPGRASSRREARQVGGTLTGEWTVTMPSQDSWIPEQLVEHDGILLSRGIPLRSNYVAKSGTNLSIGVGLLRRGHIIDLATLRI